LGLGAFVFGYLIVDFAQALAKRFEQEQANVRSAADQGEECGLADQQNVHRFHGHNIRLVWSAVKQGRFCKVVFRSQSSQAHDGVCSGLLLYRHLPADDQVERLGVISLRKDFMLCGIADFFADTCQNGNFLEGNSLKKGTSFRKITFSIRVRDWENDMGVTLKL